MNPTFKLHLQPKQMKLYRLLQSTGPGVATVIGGGGAKGGGKSAGARNIALLLASELAKQYPGMVITIVRRVARHLLDNHIQPLKRLHPELLPLWRASDNALVFEHARILFRSAETEGDVEKQFTGGFESAFVIVDEAQQFSERELQAMQMAARWTDSRVSIPANLAKCLFLFNPGGIGSSYIRRIFWSKEYEGKERPENYEFVHVFGWDNYEWFRGEVDFPGETPEDKEHHFYDNLTSEERFRLFISETSEGRKYDAFPPALRQGYLLGSFDHFEGQYFSGAWDSSLCVIPTGAAWKMIQGWWTHWMAFDWGWAGPPRPHYAVNLWLTIGKVPPSSLKDYLGIDSAWPLDVIIVYRERHWCLTPEQQVAQSIVDLTPQADRGTCAAHFVDGAMFSSDRRSEHTTADLMQPCLSDAGFPTMQPADKDRIGGWRQLYNAFVRTCQARRRPLEAEPEGPLFFVSAECATLAQSVPKLICDEDRPEDVLKTESIEDDYMDTLRYGYKSMQAASWQAPRDVRRKELYERVLSREGIDDGANETMTNAAMAVRRFDQDERKRYRRVKRR